MNITEDTMRLIAFISLIGCSPSFGPNSSEKTTGNDLDINQQDDLIQQSGLPDLLDDMDETYCNDALEDEIGGQDIAGATSYFTGTYLLEDDGWVGREKWILHPTPAWTDTNGETCYVTWETAAIQINAAGCADCDFGLSVAANINKQQTDCPEGLWKDSEETWEVDYDIKIQGDSVIFYFQNSGNVMGDGYSNDTAINFLTEPSCTWF
jgi:hypothetical protein